jgi:hypothetical protein
MSRFAVRTLIDVTLSLYPSLDIRVPSELHTRLTDIIKHLIENPTAYPDCAKASAALAGTSHPIDKLIEILQVPPDPIPNNNDSSSSDGSNSRKKSRPWSPYEDSRLLSGIYRYGIDNWTTISRFVGNGRTRSQCSQRWQRGLDPRLSRDPWTYAEDVCLLRLVQTFGDKSWTHIATKMGNRSDVQCRYRFKQMQRDMIEPPGIRKVQSGNLPAVANPAAQIVRPSKSVPTLPLKTECDGQAEKKKKEEVAFDVFARESSSEEEELIWE